MVSAKDLKELTKDLTILYAEDEPWLREKMAATLERLFKKTLVAEDGKEALELFKNNPVDLILTDINMPKMNGVDFLRNVKEITDLPPPSIVLTAHTESELLMELIDLGIDKFLNKPVDKEQMIVAFYKVCRLINDDRLLEAYRGQLEEALLEADKKNRILETKLKLIAMEKNASKAEQQHKTADVQEATPEKVVRTTMTPEATTPTISSRPMIQQEDYAEILTGEDQDELADLSQEMDSFITMLFRKDDVDISYLKKLSNVYKKVGAILNGYPSFHEVGLTLVHFGKVLYDQADSLYTQRHKLALLLESFHYSLENFRIAVWQHQTVEPTYYNASLISDVEQILMTVLKQEIDNEMELF